MTRSTHHGVVARGYLIGVWLACAGCHRVFALDEVGPLVPDAATPGDDPALRVWLEMDDLPAGGTVVESAEQRQATCAPCPTLTVGRDGGAFAFDDSLVDIVGDDLEFTSGFTIAVWVRIETAPNLACFVSKPLGTGSANSFILCLGGDRVEYTTHAPDSSADIQLGPTVALATWHHVAMTWDGGVKVGYFDGTSVVSAPAVQIGFDAGNVIVGGDRNAGNRTLELDGWLDDVRIYDRPLSSAEIEVLAMAL